MTLSPRAAESGTAILTPAQRLGRAFLSGGLATAFGLLLLSGPGSLPTCAFHDLTGYSCLTCGLTRSLQALARGDLASSIAGHVMGPLLALAIVLGILHAGAEALTGRRHFTTTRSMKAPLLCLALAWVTYGGIRLAAELAR